MRHYDTLVNPEIEGLLSKTQSKFGLVILGARRARQITSYFGQLGEGLGASIPPQITSTSRKPLSIALEEVEAEKIVPIELPEDFDEVQEFDEVKEFVEVQESDEVQESESSEILDVSGESSIGTDALAAEEGIGAVNPGEESA